MVKSPAIIRSSKTIWGLRPLPFARSWMILRQSLGIDRKVGSLRRRRGFSISLGWFLLPFGRDILFLRGLWFKRVTILIGRSWAGIGLIRLDFERIEDFFNNFGCFYGRIKRVRYLAINDSIQSRFSLV